ncbi:MAG: hypothetical protein RR897_09110 [Pseudomonas sp.]
MINCSPEQYAIDPETLRKAFTHVSDGVMNKLVDDLKQSPAPTFKGCLGY